MSSKVENIRYTRTKQALIESFEALVNEKDFKKITVLDITTRAGVNRATFYAHFQDKYALIDEVIGDSAVHVIEKCTDGIIQFTRDSVQQLVLAVCNYHQQLKDRCTRSYLSTAPLIKEQMMFALKQYLTEAIGKQYPQNELELFIPMYATMIYEAGYLWGTDQVTLDSQQLAQKTATLVIPD